MVSDKLFDISFDLFARHILEFTLYHKFGNSITKCPLNFLGGKTSLSK